LANQAPNVRLSAAVQNLSSKVLTQNKLGLVDVVIWATAGFETLVFDNNRLETVPQMHRVMCPLIKGAVDLIV
jgi:hypothetical protein